MKENKKYMIITGLVALYLLKKYGMSGIKQTLVDIGLKYEGIKELGTNWSFNDKDFEKKMIAAGWKRGDEWCAYFVKMVFLQAFPKDVAELKKILSGATQKLFNNAAADTSGKYKVITSGVPEPGDIAIWVRSNNAAKGHAGLVIKADENYFYTIEGNTDKAGSPIGQQVVRHKRPLQYGVKMPNSILKLRGFVRKIT